MRKLKVLVLHSLGNPANSPIFLKHHVFALQKYCPEHEYFYHDTTTDNPWELAHLEVDAIILDVTFLCARWAIGGGFLRLKRDYAFIADCKALKLAFPQDEYDCHELLDDWMCEWRVDIVFSVIAHGWDILYPKYSRTGEIRLAYTGYIDDSLCHMQPSPWDSRPIDIGYRARKLPPYFGRLGETKWQIGELVNRRSQGTNLVTDIVVGDGGTLNGATWLDFINRSKFTLGANSGSSLLDPRGKIQLAVRRYIAKYPEASFDEVEQACFPGLDGHNEFTAISPRALEAGMLGSCQILVEGSYSDILKPWQHYIPIKPDASDFDAVREAMCDRSLTDRLIANCRATLLNTPALHYRAHAQGVIDLIVERREGRAEGAIVREIRPTSTIEVKGVPVLMVRTILFKAVRSVWRLLLPQTAVRTRVMVFIGRLRG